MGGERSGLSWRARAALAAGSLVLALGAAEGLARLVHRGAHAHLDLYRADARYGVTLEPGGRARLRSRTGRVTEVAINRQGFRGGEWPGEARDVVPGRTLVLGDSQAFGYGVDWKDTFSARLPGEVLNAAVPSWGPLEYLRALEALAPRYLPSRVVLVANAANDWFEAAVPNTRRTSAEDGWAVRARPDRPRPRAFPGRELLLGRSHLALAVRRLFLRGDSDGEPAPADAARTLLRDVAKLRRAGAHRSRLTPLVAAADRVCHAHGCRLVVAALPLDVQVDPAEWRKYRSAPADLSPTLVLLEDLVADARALGVDAIDLTGALRAASPGAFLPDDYHLSPRGHAAVAHALAPLVVERATLARGAP